MLTRDLRTRDERVLWAIAVAVSALAWLALAATLVGAAYGLAIGIVIAIGHALSLAHVQGNGIRIGPAQLPELHARVKATCQKLGLSGVPETYVLQSGGMLNAFATKLLGRRFVVLHSELVDACEPAEPSPRPCELDFVIAHEIAHLVLGHLSWFLLPARLVPWLGPAYSRACEYTADRVGHHVVGDLEISSRALAVLAGGQRAGRRLNLQAFMDQRAEAGRFWMAVYELNASHPYLSRRVAALRDWAMPAMATPEPRRNPLAYPLAPAVALVAGGSATLAVVAVIGVISAVAIPAFLRYVERAKAAAVTFDDEARRALTPAPAVLSGDAGWQLETPGPGWMIRSRQLARRDNPLADGWLVLPDQDAQIFVIPEDLASAVSADAYATAVISTARPARLVSNEALPAGNGRLVHLREDLAGASVDSLIGVVVDDTRGFRIVTQAKSDRFPALREQLLAAITSFRPSRGGRD